MALDDDAPISTGEFLKWVTQDRKRQKKTSAIASSVVIVFMVVVSISAYTTSHLASSAMLSELANQKVIASLRASRNESVSVNETVLCRIVFTLIGRQKRIANIITSDPVFAAHAHDKLFVQRQTAAKSLDKEINGSTMPQCDGFPSAAVPSAVVPSVVKP